jgi:iron complex outermembrane recepter protein
VAYGRGYRSPMALLLDDGEPAPFVTVQSADFGFKYTLDEQEHLTVRASAFTTHLSDDVAFEPSEGRAESVGPSKRNGFTLYADARPAPWAFLALSATYVHAALQKPPYASAEDPSPPFRKGQLLPYVPPFVLRADGSVTRELFQIQKVPVQGRAGVGYSLWSARPLPYGQEAKPVSLLDAELSANYRAATLTFSCFNLLDAEYAALELSYPSSWNPDGFASRVPARHVMAGAPRTLFLSLGVTL